MSRRAVERCKEKEIVKFLNNAFLALNTAMFKRQIANFLLCFQEILRCPRHFIINLAVSFLIAILD